MEFNVTKKEIFNGKNNAHKAEYYLDQTLTIKGLFTYEDDVMNKETGEVSKATLVHIVTSAGTLICMSDNNCYILGFACNFKGCNSECKHS